MEGDKLKQKNVRITLFQGVLDLWPKPLSLISRKDFMLLAKYLAVFESLGCRCIPIFILLKGRERSRQRRDLPSAESLAKSFQQREKARTKLEPETA